MGGENVSRPIKILITDDERDLVEMLAFPWADGDMKLPAPMTAWERGGG